MATTKTPNQPQPPNVIHMIAEQLGITLANIQTYRVYPTHIVIITTDYKKIIVQEEVYGNNNRKQPQ